MERAWSADSMDSEHREVLFKTRALIEKTRREISQLHEEIRSAWRTIDRNGFCRAQNRPHVPLQSSGQERGPGSSRVHGHLRQQSSPAWAPRFYFARTAGREALRT